MQMTRIHCVFREKHTVSRAVLRIFLCLQQVSAIISSIFDVKGSNFGVQGSDFGFSRLPFWFVVRGSWFVVRGSWFVVRGSWFVVRGSWFVVNNRSPGQKIKGQRSPPNALDEKSAIYAIGFFIMRPGLLKI
jgi:hypothetical protein